MSEKIRYEHAVAMAFAEDIRDLLAPTCERIEIAGSLRRRKPMVGDIELVYTPKFGEVITDLFAQNKNLTDILLEELVQEGLLEKRKNIRGSTAYGEKNKLMRHRPSEIPVDLFSTTTEAWASYLLCRTGGAESNTQLAGRAKALGMEWKPYEGVLHHRGTDIRIKSEEHMYELLNLPYRAPHERT